MNYQQYLYLKMLLDNIEECADRSARCNSVEDADMWDGKIESSKNEILEFVERICNDKSHRKNYPW